MPFFLQGPSMLAQARFLSLAVPVLTVLSLTSPFAAWAQATPSATAQQAQAWREANDRVGRFVRGHIDILREEARQAEGSGAPPSARQADAEAPTQQALYRAMLLRRPDLFVERGVSGQQMLAVSADTAELRHRAQRLWVDTSLALQEQVLLQQRVEAAEIAHELGRRMVAVGNWSANQGWMTDLDRLALQREQARTAQDLRGLEADLERLGGIAAATQLRWPELPAPPAAGEVALLNTPAGELEALALARHPAWSALDAQARVARQSLPSGYEAALRQAMQAWVDVSLAAATDPLAAPQPVEVDPRDTRWSHAAARATQETARLAALEDEIRLQVRDAVARLQLAHDQAAQRLGQEAKLHQAVLDDAQQRYNGMFTSTWDLLQALDQHLLAQAETQRAVAQFWSSHAALQALVAGAPYQRASAGGAAAPGAARAARPH